MAQYGIPLLAKSNEIHSVSTVLPSTTDGGVIFLISSFFGHQGDTILGHNLAICGRIVMKLSA